MYLYFFCIFLNILKKNPLKKLKKKNEKINGQKICAHVQNRIEPQKFTHTWHIQYLFILQSHTIQSPTQEHGIHQFFESCLPNICDTKIVTLGVPFILLRGLAITEGGILYWLVGGRGVDSTPSSGAPIN